MPVVVNFHDYKSKEALASSFGDDWMYVGRKNVHYHLAQSALANPFANSDKAQAQLSKTPIADYKRWIWGKMLRRDRRVVQALEDIEATTALVCWCKPTPCHAEVIVDAVDWWKNKQSVADMPEQFPDMALSVRQPWPWLMLRPDVIDNEARVQLYRTGEIKDVENRTWTHTCRGWFLIHASKTFDKPGYEFAKHRFPHIPMPEPDEYELGGIVGMAYLVTMVEQSDSPWFFGPKGFVLREARPLPFVEAQGMQKFFRVEMT